MVFDIANIIFLNLNTIYKNVRHIIKVYFIIKTIKSLKNKISSELMT